MTKLQTATVTREKGKIRKKSVCYFFHSVPSHLVKFHKFEYVAEKRKTVLKVRQHYEMCVLSLTIPPKLNGRSNTKKANDM